MSQTVKPKSWILGKNYKGKQKYECIICTSIAI